MNLTIDVHFYGELADFIGMNQLELPVEKSLLVLEVKQQLVNYFPNWHAFNSPIYNVVNRNLVDDNALVNVGDILAFFPDKPMI